MKTKSIETNICIFLKDIYDFYLQQYQISVIKLLSQTQY